jgi:mono/diheme cytochrome c family protein
VLALALAVGSAMAALAALAALSVSLPKPASAQTVTGAELGRHEFDMNCAICHGIDARGGGPMRPFLARVPADLTSLARRNGGVFPKDAVAELIDGRATAEPGPHGTREMPIWGNVYREQSDYQMRGMPFPSDWTVRGRILALTDYLSTLQQR